MIPVFPGIYQGDRRLSPCVFCPFPPVMSTYPIFQAHCKSSIKSAISATDNIDKIPTSPRDSLPHMITDSTPGGKKSSSHTSQITDKGRHAAVSVALQVGGAAASRGRRCELGAPLQVGRRRALPGAIIYEIGSLLPNRSRLREPGPVEDPVHEIPPILHSGRNVKNLLLCRDANLKCRHSHLPEEVLS